MQADETAKDPQSWPPDDGGENAQRVPRRLFPGPIWEQSLLRDHPPNTAQRLRKLAQAYPDLPRILPVVALYWADGQRTLSDIVNLVELETGQRAAAYLAEYFEILAQLQVIQW